MNDGRRRRKAKQARRDARRTNARDEGTPPTLPETPEETPLIDEVRGALATGQPLDLLGMVSLLIEATRPHPLEFVRIRQQREVVRLDDLVAGFIGVPIVETTALLAMLAELLVDDDELRLRCRREAAARHDPLPPWVADLPQVDVYRVVRKTHVLGDGDELLIGARFPSGHELTCVAYIDHLAMSLVQDAFFVPDSIDNVLSVAAQQDTDPDARFVGMTLADARAWIQHGLKHPVFTVDSDSWPGCRPLVQWLIRHMPEGGDNYEEPSWDAPETRDVPDQFFASPSGTPFNDFDHRDLLLELVDAGTGDPLRWSSARIAKALGNTSYIAAISLESALDVPDLLRAFVPFAHARSGIRDELTAEALAVIDEMAPRYERRVLEAPQYQDGADDD
jgi:hypothetical protein